MPLVIPVFIAHQGCSQLCLFCNQQVITGAKQGGKVVAVQPAQVEAIIAEWLARPRRRKESSKERAGSVQVAFYGGSFTCLPPAYQESLLAAVQPFLQRGEVAAIRLSTRPDCVDAATCVRLYDAGVRIIELGVQSLDDRVLAAARRGHDADACRRAVAVLQKAGFELGMQLMPGLPLENTASFLRTMREVVALAPAFVRLYPALVLEGTGLATAYRRGEYRPLSLNRALALTARAYDLLTSAGIRVVRMGLQATTTIEKDLLAGPYHPAFGELVIARSWFRRIRPLLAACPPDKRLTVQIAPADLSAVLGQRRSNWQRWQQLGLAERLEIITEATQARGTLSYAVH